MTESRVKKYTLSNNLRQRIAELENQTAFCLNIDRHPLLVKLNRIALSPGVGADVDADLDRIEQSILKSIHARQWRKQNTPVAEFVSELPIAARKADIASAIAENQVIVVAGETGSGKTTQLPKIALTSGRGQAGFIGHTQPRRIAARTIAYRLAEELNSPIGTAVGYKVRFTDKTDKNSFIKVMTDGILLAETQQDRYLNQYDTIIIDEAHERSLNIDFLLGYLKHILPKRPDLKVIITSATIDTARFSRHFNNAPVVEVSGRSYPVQVRYHPLSDEEERGQDREKNIIDALHEIDTIDRQGDVLVFLNGEKEIRDLEALIRKHYKKPAQILPLYSRLSVQEQNRIFHTGQSRRIVLSTNVAETSLTVPGIRFVIDPGTARISRYSYRNKVQRLPIEKISQASANQRKGRCGRVSAGVCFRLYTEEDFNQREAYTEPEIRRTNLASVILQMKSLRLGDIDQFPFIDPPDQRHIKDGLNLLKELGAIDSHNKLTRLGGQLARLPLDPKLGRMVLAAKEQNALNEVLIIASALSIQDPRERPHDAKQKADEKHKEFTDPESDFLSLLNLWQRYQEKQSCSSKNQVRKYCVEYFLSWLRMREWEDIYRQLSLTVKEMGFKLNQTPASYQDIHCAILTGLLSNIGTLNEGREYTGARNIKFTISPASAMYQKPAKWVMAAELVETTGLYAHMVAKIAPEWVVKSAQHIINRSYSEPHWQSEAQRVAALERITLYGLTLASNKRVNYGPIAPVESREIFIQAALVEHRFKCRENFFIHNQRLIQEIHGMEDRMRKRDLLVDEKVIYQLYDQVIPRTVYDGPSFYKWLKAATEQTLEGLFFQKHDLLNQDEPKDIDELFPRTLPVTGAQLNLEYRFIPGDATDGVTARVPLVLLQQLKSRDFDGLVPGLLREKIIALIRSLPKSIRRNLVPIPDHADACLQEMQQNPNTRFLDILLRYLEKRAGMKISPEMLSIEQLEPHLQMKFKIVDGGGKAIRVDTSLANLKEYFSRNKGDDYHVMTVPELERDNIVTWDFSDLQESYAITVEGLSITVYPALVDCEKSVSLKLFNSASVAAAEHRKGIRRLFSFAAKKQIQYLEKNLPRLNEICAHFLAFGTCEEVKSALVNVILDMTLFQNNRAVLTRNEFESRVADTKANLMSTANRVCDLVADTFNAYARVKRELARQVSPKLLESIQDMQSQLKHLINAGYFQYFDLQWCQHMPRFLHGMETRLNKLKQFPENDFARARVIAPYWKNYLDRYAQDCKAVLENPDWQYYRWMIEEMRISLFAQELKTSISISEKRLQEQHAKIS